MVKKEDTNIFESFREVITEALSENPNLIKDLKLSLEDKKKRVKERKEIRNKKTNKCEKVEK